MRRRNERMSYLAVNSDSGMWSSSDWESGMCLTNTCTDEVSSPDSGSRPAAAAWSGRHLPDVHVGAPQHWPAFWALGSIQCSRSA
mmetsp:Transcript_36703/g.86054  ORF Transcript_36703/g.86054 Transcript_36703/m.86054 type:complete len:85 (+) Transcript_36703:1259-1513(+)